MTTVLTPRAAQYGEKEALQQFLAYQHLAAQPGLLAHLACYSRAPQPQPYAHSPPQPQPLLDRPYVDALWLLHADTAALVPASRMAALQLATEPQPRSAFVKWCPQLNKQISRPTGSTLEPSDSSLESSGSKVHLPAKRSLKGDSPRSAPPFAREESFCKATRTQGGSPRHSSTAQVASQMVQQPRLSIQVTAKTPACKTQPAPALAKIRTQSSSALDLLQLCEQANAAVRNRSRPPLRNQSTEAQPRNLSLAHRQALEAAQRRHLNARFLQAARRAADPSTHSHPTAQVSLPASGRAV